MVPGSDKGTKYSRTDLEKIRKRAREIWARKRESFNTALNDWLQAEQELKAGNKLEHTRSDQYTGEEIAKIKERAQAIRDMKVRSLHTAFDDWIEAEQELKEELTKKINILDLFDMWFLRVSPRVASLLNEETPVRHGIFDSELGKEYVELMSECIK